MFDLVSVRIAVSDKEERELSAVTGKDDQSNPSLCRTGYAPRTPLGIVNVWFGDVNDPLLKP